MSFWIFLQVIANLVFIVFGVVLWRRARKRSMVHPNLSQALQVLQNKIAILEDLSDRVETQVKQVGTLLDNKGLSLEDKMAQAQRQIHQVEQSISKSMKVAEIFEDKIPHQEILERQNTIKYVEAAKLAHAGMSIDEISKRVNLPQNEIKFIAKVNHKELVFSESQLPDWIKKREVEHREVKNSLGKLGVQPSESTSYLPRDGIETPLSITESNFVEDLKRKCEDRKMERDSISSGVAIQKNNEIKFTSPNKRGLFGDKERATVASEEISQDRLISSPLLQRAFLEEESLQSPSNAQGDKTLNIKKNPKKMIQLIKTDYTRSELGVMRGGTELIEEGQVRTVEFPKN